MNTQLAADRPAYALADFASAVGLSRAYLYKLIRTGRGPRVVKVGNKSFIRTADGLAWLAAQQAAA